MEKTIFYSWQSDLPNNNNRGFIQDCIESAIKEIKDEDVHLEIAIDRDTQGVSGTPDIASTIFSKIDQASVFIADVSIINQGLDIRKTPNPNVLIELGYAAKTIGWQNVICVFNADFGKVEDLPFDLKFRRPLIYKVNNPSNRSKDKKLLTAAIKTALLGIINKLSARDEINSYIKQNVDPVLLVLCNDIHKILYSYEIGFAGEKIWPMLQLSVEEVKQLLFERSFIGFTVLKDWHRFQETLTEQMNKPFFIQHADQKAISSLLKIVKSLDLVIHVLKFPEVFSGSGVMVPGHDVHISDSCLLLKHLDDKEAIVIDSGRFEIDKKGVLLQVYHIRPEKFESYSHLLQSLIRSINIWVKNTGNSFHLGPNAN
jgi:hypothetical protein